MSNYGALERNAPGSPRRMSLPGSAEIVVSGNRAHVPIENYDRRKSLGARMHRPSESELWPRSFRTSQDIIATRGAVPEGLDYDFGKGTPGEEKSLIRKPTLAATETGFERPVGTASFSQTTFNGINTMLGCGILSLPYAFRSAGWLLGVSVLLLLLGATNYTAKQLRKCLDFYPGIRSFPDIGEVAFGPRGRYLISVLFYFEIFTAAVMYIILAADNLLILFPDWQQWQFVVLVTIIVLPQASTDKLDLLSYFSLLGIIASAFLIGVVVYFGGSTTEQPGSYLNPMPTHLLPPDFVTSLIAYGLIMVGFAGHACLPSIYESMEQPQKYDRMLDVTWVILGAVYLGVATLGYLMYGDTTEDQITKNITGRGILATLSVWLIVINPITKYGINSNPISLAFEEVSPKFVPRHLLFIFNVGMRWLLTLAVAVVAVGIPNFARVTGFIGSVFSFSVSIIFPAAAYLKMFGDEVPMVERLFNYFLLAASAVMMVFGTAGSIISDVPV